MVLTHERRINVFCSRVTRPSSPPAREGFRRRPPPPARPQRQGADHDLARALSRRTEKGKAYGAVTAKALAVLEALLWGFHNARSGLCFPSYETIAERAGCARSTVAEASRRLRTPEFSHGSIASSASGSAATTSSAISGSARVIRTSNGYQFNDPKPPARPDSLGNSSKSDFPSGTPI